MREEHVEGRARWSGGDYATESSHHRSFDDWFLNRLAPGPGDVVIDLGCGTGEFTERLAELVGQGRVVGVEPDASMLDTARRHARHNLTFIRAAADDFADAVGPSSADLVLSRAMLHWLDVTSYPAVFSAVSRALRPGGWFHSESGGAGNAPLIVRLLSEVAAQFGLPEPPPFPDAGIVFDLVEQAGFEVADEGVRTVAQRRRFTQEQMIGLVRTQAVLALTRTAAADRADAILDAALSRVEQLRRFDGTYDQTFVRVEILARKPCDGGAGPNQPALV